MEAGHARGPAELGCNVKPRQQRPQQPLPSVLCYCPPAHPMPPPRRALSVHLFCPSGNCWPRLAEASMDTMGPGPGHSNPTGVLGLGLPLACLPPLLFSLWAPPSSGDKSRHLPSLPVTIQAHLASGLNVSEPQFSHECHGDYKAQRVQTKPPADRPTHLA